MPRLTMELAGDRQPCYGNIKIGKSLLPGRNRDPEGSPTGDEETKLCKSKRR